MSMAIDHKPNPEKSAKWEQARKEFAEKACPYCGEGAPNSQADQSKNWGYNHYYGSERF